MKTNHVLRRFKSKSASTENADVPLNLPPADAKTADATIVGEDSVTNPPEAKLSPRGCTRSARQFLTLSRGSTTPSSQTRENDEMSSTSADQFSAQAISAKGARLLRLSQQIEGDEEEANRLNTVSEARDGAPIHAAPPRRGGFLIDDSQQKGIHEVLTALTQAPMTSGFQSLCGLPSLPTRLAYRLTATSLNLPENVSSSD